MATLKDLIKTETLKVGATSCAPSGSVVDLAGILRDGNTEYVLPESGYVSLCAPSPINTWAGLSCNEIASQARSDAADSWVTHHIYGKKGDVVKITVDKVSRIGWVRFVNAIGGGYKRYLKALACNRFGGSLWLRLKTTSEWNRALSCLQTRSGLLRNLHRMSVLASLFRSQIYRGSTTTSLLKRVGFMLRSCLLSRGILSTSFQILEDQAGSQVLGTVLEKLALSRHQLLLKREQSATYTCLLNQSTLHTLSHQLVASNNARMEVAA